MLLLQLRDLLQSRPRVNLMEMCRCLESDPEAVRGMLTHWLRKGKVRQCPKPNGCGSRCTQCNVAHAEVYEWVS